MNRMITDLSTFVSGVVAIILIVVSVSEAEQGAPLRARQLRELALALALLVLIVQIQQSGIAMKARIILAALGTCALLLPLRHRRV